MPFSARHQARLTRPMLRTALLIGSLWVPLPLYAQQLNTSNSSSSSSSEGTNFTQPLSATELPDAPSALQTSLPNQTPAPPPRTTDDPTPATSTGTHQTKRVLAIWPTFTPFSPATSLPPQPPRQNLT